MKRAYRNSEFGQRVMKVARSSKVSLVSSGYRKGNNIYMKMTLLSGLVIVLMAAACTTQDKKSELTGKWQAVSLENSRLDSLMAEQRRFLDTFGTNTTNEQNIAMYGFTNIDSARQVLKNEMTEYQAMQDHAVTNTWFDFRKDGVVVMNFSGQMDSTKWQINDEGKLVLDEPAEGGEAGKISMDILSLTDSMLKLQMTEQGMSSIVIFKPADN